MHRPLLNAAFVALLVSTPRAQGCGDSFVEGFTALSNVGAWVWDGTFQADMSSGGAPGWFLCSELRTTEIPRLRSTQSSPYTGNYRSMHVTSVGVDLQSLRADAGCSRPLTLVLVNETLSPDLSVAFVTTGDVPCADGDWHSYTVDVAAQSTTLPPGWTASSGSPDATWNAVITGVTSVQWHFGDPHGAYASAAWITGADNPRIAYQGGPTTYCTSKQTSLGCAPSIVWSGIPSATSLETFDVNAEQIVAGQNGMLFYSLTPAALPFQGGLLCVGAPQRRTAVQSAGGSAGTCTGEYSYDFNARIRSGVDATLTAGTAVFAQYWFRDPVAASATGLTNALRFTICP